jgi:hypothetical protein
MFLRLRDTRSREIHGSIQHRGIPTVHRGFEGNVEPNLCRGGRGYDSTPDIHGRQILLLEFRLYREAIRQKMPSHDMD